MMIRNTKDAIVTTQYVLGLIESDGSYLMNLHRDGHFSCGIRISSKSNENTLESLKIYFEEKGFVVRYEKGKETTSTVRGRAPCIVFEGNVKLRKWFEEVEKLNLPFIHAGVKHRTFQILKYLLFNKTTKAERIALKKSLHKSNQNELDFVDTQRKPRESFEQELGVPVGQSSIEGREILNVIDQQYDAHRLDIETKISNGKLQVNPDWLAGVLDGDGHFHVSIKKSKTGFFWGTAVQLTMEKRSILTLQILRYVARSSKNIQSSPEKNSVVIAIGVQEDVERIIKFVSKSLKGNLRIQQYNNVKQVFFLREKNLLKNKEYVIALLNEVYRVSSLSKKGAHRSMTLDQALEWAENL